jgi:hypothetical protein
MKIPFETAFKQMPLLQSFSKLELRTPHHLSDFQPFSLELINHTHRIRTIALVLFMLGLLAISSTLSFELWQLNPDVINENALLELAQGAALLAAALIQSVRALSADNVGLKRDIHTGLALFAFALVLREVDVDKLGSSAAWSVLETLMRVLAFVLIIGFVMKMSRKMHTVTRNLRKILLSPTVTMTILGCMLYAGAWPFDKELFEINNLLSLWFEETIELNACLLLLGASLMSNIKTDIVQIKAHSL